MAPVPKWPLKIKAPKEALMIYRWMAKAQFSKAFQECHIFDGARNPRGVPLVSWENQTTSLPKVVCSFMGLQYKRKTCTTPGCMNPFHYISTGDPKGFFEVEAEGAPAPTPIASLKDYIDLVKDTIEENDLKSPQTFKQLRSIIHADDISDALLQKVLHEISSPKL